MRALEFLTALTIATASSVAVAQPIPVPPETYDRESARPYDHYDRDASQRDRYSRADANRHARDAHGRWIPLARATETIRGPQYISLDGRGGSLALLRIEADRGTPVIKRVAVEYTNGTREIVRIPTPLNYDEGQVIELEGNRRVSRIVVVTDPRYYGMYSLYGL